MSMSWCGKICITPPKCMRDERRRSYYSGFSVVLETLWKRNYFVWDTKEDTTRNQWLWCIYNTVPEQTQILECVQRILRRTAWSKTVSIKWSNSSFTSFWLTACKYVLLFKELATSDSNVSFEPCRVALVWCFSDQKCRNGNVYIKTV